MTARVPFIPPSVSRLPVQIARSVSSSSFMPLSEMNNWSLGRNGALVPGFCPGGTGDGYSIGTGGSSKTLRFNVFPRVAALKRLWTLQLRREDVGGGEDVAIAIPAGATAVNRFVASASEAVLPVQLFEDVTSPSSSEQEISVNITNSGTIGLFLLTLGCHEIPRIRLDQDTTEFGTDIEFARGGEAIFRTLSVGKSLDVGRAIKEAETIVRRNSLLQWAIDTADAPSTASASFVDFFELPPRVLARRKGEQSIVTETSWRIYARNTDGATAGEFRIQSTAGDSLTISIPTSASSFTWLPAAGGGKLDVDAEDVTAIDGRRNQRWEELTVEWRRTSGTGSIEVASVSGSEAA